MKGKLPPLHAASRGFLPFAVLREIKAFLKAGDLWRYYNSIAPHAKEGIMRVRFPVIMGVRTPGVLVTNSKLARALTKLSSVKPSLVYALLTRLFSGPGDLVGGNGPKWKEDNRAIRDEMTPTKVKLLRQMILTIIRDGIDKWRLGPRDVLHDAEEITIEVILSMTFGKVIAQQVRDDVLHYFSEMTLSSTWRTEFKFGWYMVPFLSSIWRREQRAKRRLQNLISRGIDAAPEGTIAFKLRTEEPHKSDRERSVGVLMSLLFAGKDTTAGTFLHLVRYLAIHPTIQRTLSKEIRSALQKYSKIELMDLEFFSQVCPKSFQIIMVTMMIDPVAPMYARVTTQDIEIDGWLIPKGTIMWFATDYILENETGIHEVTDYEKWVPHVMKHLVNLEFADESDRRCIGRTLAMTELLGIVIEMADQYISFWHPDPENIPVKLHVTLVPVPKEPFVIIKSLRDEEDIQSEELAS